MSAAEKALRKTIAAAALDGNYELVIGLIVAAGVDVRDMLRTKDAKRKARWRSSGQKRDNVPDDVPDNGGTMSRTSSGRCPDIEPLSPSHSPSPGSLSSLDISSSSPSSEPLPEEGLDQEEREPTRESGTRLVGQPALIAADGTETLIPPPGFFPGFCAAVDSIRMHRGRPTKSNEELWDIFLDWLREKPRRTGDWGATARTFARKQAEFEERDGNRQRANGGPGPGLRTPSGRGKQEATPDELEAIRGRAERL